MDSLNQLAITDALTGLFNRGHIMDLLGGFVREIDNLSRYESESNPANLHSIGVIFADISRFHDLNEIFGHGPGDQILQYVGKVIQSLLATNEAASRYGNDKFLILLPNLSKEETRQRAEHLRHAVSQNNTIVDGNHRVQITLSVGVAHYFKVYDKPIGYYSPHTKLSGVEAIMKAADDDLMRNRAQDIQKLAATKPG